jgi:hypothetical protein
MGNTTTASGSESTAVGYNNIASGSQCLVAGNGSTGSGTACVAMGVGVVSSHLGTIAMGNYATASADYDTAIGGAFDTASGGYSIALGGYSATASGGASTALGKYTVASGTLSTAMGLSTTASSYLEVVMGQYNSALGTSTTAWVSTDPIFEIGIGSTTTSTADAMAVLKNGKVGIGTTSPTATLDVAGAIRAESDSYVSSDLSKTSSTTLGAITGLTSGTLTAGKAYAFDIWLYTTSNSSGGIKVDLNGGSATATTLIGDSQEWDGTSIGVRAAFSAWNTSLCAITAVSTAPCHITGTIIVNAGGTFIPEFAQNASNGTASKVKTGSFMLIRQLN